VGGDAHLAQDVAQTVFTIWRARRSDSSDALLGGWLYQHTCFTASSGQDRAPPPRRESQAVGK